MELKFEALTEDKIDLVVPMYVDYFNTHDGGEWTRENAYKRIHQYVTIDDSYGLIAFDGEKVIGFCMGYFAQFDDGVAYDLVEILIAKDYQNKGVGSRLIGKIEEHAKLRGALVMELTAINDEMHTHFYGKLGFGNAINNVLKTKTIVNK